jgi:crotonobetainyl-CoA:carnitine CoA-transferase CaiB-like acyl-CoA transferase
MEAAQRDSPPAPLEGLRVVDAASLFAGPMIGMMLGDFGADVIKIEHPDGDNLRGFGWSKEDVSLWWALVGRNKRSVTLKLSDPRGAKVALDLLESADVFVENFRPGRLEQWGLGVEKLHEVNPRLVVVRTTGFGQTGPYKDRPGFGTLAEAMSGFAHINGFADGPPTLPPLALADGVAGLTGTCAAMFALWWRERGGTGQVIDLSIYEPLFWLLGAQATAYDQLDMVQERGGNRAPFTSPRNAYQARDGRWIVVSGSSQSIAERIMEAVGRADLIDEPWFGSHAGRLEHQDRLDEAIAAWIAERDRDEVIEHFERFEAAAGPIYSIEDIFEDPQFIARETIATVDHPRLGPIRMQNVVPRLSATPGSIRHCGPELGQHNDEILGGELGLSAADLAALADAGVTARPINEKTTERQTI